MTPDEATAFAESWYGAWNRHDLDGIMGHYDVEIRHSSPFIARYDGPLWKPSDRELVGIDAVREYFRRALERNPTLRFDPMHVTTGLESVLLVYRRMSGDLAGEVFFFNDRLKIVRSVSHYG